MWEKISKSIANLLCLKSNRLRHRNQVLSETVHDANLDVQRVSSHVCLEESRPCMCNHSIKNLESVENGIAIEHSVEANGSFAHAVINMIGMLLGLGQLSTPYALERGGWASAFMLIGLGIICAFTSYLLGKCLEMNPKSRSFRDIGQHAFGTKGRVLAATLLCMEIFTALLSYTISLHDNLIRVLSGMQINVPWAKLSSSQLLTLIAVLIALPSLWLRKLSSLSYLSSAGIFLSLLMFTSVPLTAIFGDVTPNHKIPVLQLHNIPAISGLYIFSYAGHIVFPDLYKGMKDPSKFTKVSIVSFTIVTTLYTTLAFLGAKLFGPEVNPQITLSMPPHLVVTKIALWATVLTPMTKYALELAPLSIQLDHKLPDSMSSKSKMIIRGGVCSFIVIMILVLALSVPYFEYVLSLTGSLVSVAICVILPCAFYTKICWGQISKPLIVLNLSLVAFGFLLGTVGTISSSKLLLQSLRRRGHHSA
jgi:amino acid permease